MPEMQNKIMKSIMNYCIFEEFLMWPFRPNHRHLSNIESLSFVMFPLLALLLIGFFFFAAAVYSTNEANKAGGTHH